MIHYFGISRHRLRWISNREVLGDESRIHENICNNSMIARGLFALSRWPTRWILSNTIALGSRNSVFRMKSFIIILHLGLSSHATSGNPWNNRFCLIEYDSWSKSWSSSFSLAFYSWTCSTIWCNASVVFSTLFTLSLNSVTLISITFIFFVSVMFYSCWHNVFQIIQALRHCRIGPIGRWRKTSALYERDFSTTLGRIRSVHTAPLQCTLSRWGLANENVMDFHFRLCTVSDGWI